MELNAGTAILMAEILGFLLASYGVLRESFADLAQSRPFSEGRYGEGTYGGPNRTVRVLVRTGLLLRLLPKDKKLSITDRYKNAALAISGVILAGAALIVDLFV